MKNDCKSNTEHFHDFIKQYPLAWREWQRQQKEKDSTEKYRKKHRAIVKRVAAAVETEFGYPEQRQCLRAMVSLVDDFGRSKDHV